MGFYQRRSWSEKIFSECQVCDPAQDETEWSLKEGYTVDATVNPPDDCTVVEAGNGDGSGNGNGSGNGDGSGGGNGSGNGDGSGNGNGSGNGGSHSNDGDKSHDDTESSAYDETESSA